MMRPPVLGKAKAEVFYGIQALRGLAACFIVAYHATGLWSVAILRPTTSLVWSNGQVGVNIFFVISGFVMAVTSLNKAEGGAASRKFLERRLIRIFPLYWLLLTAFLLKVHVHPPLGADAPLYRSHFQLLCDYLLVPNHVGAGLIRPVIAPAWTLTFEIFFYIIFAMALLFRGHVLRVLTGTILLCTIVSFFHRDSWPAVAVVLRPILLQFLAGVWLARTKDLWAQRYGRVVMLLGVLALAGIIFVPMALANPLRDLALSVYGIAVVAMAVAAEPRIGQRIPRLLLMLGDASYSIYLTHFLLNATQLRALKLLHPLTPGVVRVPDELVVTVFALLTGVLFGLGVYYAIERPMNRSLRTWLHLRQQRTAAA